MTMTYDMACRFARHVIATYESAEAQAETFCEQFKPRSHKDGLYEQLVKDYREACGGEVLYEASKAFLAGGAEEETT